MPSISRNPKLAYIFFKSGLVEERGIGMQELKAFKDDNDLPDPSFRMEEGHFVITVYRKKKRNTGIEKINMRLEVLNEEESRGYKYLKVQKHVSKKQYAEHFQIDPKKAQRHLSKFKKLKLVNQKGKGPSTRYVVI